MSKREFVISNLVMFASLKAVLRYTKIIVITPEEHDQVVN